jgi:hypothetical protein
VWKSIEKENIRSPGACRRGRGACRRRRRSRRRPARIPPRGSLPRSSPPGAGRRSPRDELAAGSGLLQPRGAYRGAAQLLPMGAGRARPPRRGSTIATGSLFAWLPPASSTFLSEQISHQQPANSTLLSEQTSTSHQPPANRTG